MKLASSAKPVFLALGIGVSLLSACGDGGTPDMATSYTWTQVSTDMKQSCALAGCHLKGSAQTFLYDTSLTPGQDMANYTALMAVMPALINKSAPASSVLITVAKGGMYNGMQHSSSLTTAKATSWTAWITAGASFP